jgi:spermidine synthase
MDYSAMAEYYDDIMLLGRYFDYAAVAEHVAAVTDARRVLELGVGTGLVVEHLLKYRSDYDAVTVSTSRTTRPTPAGSSGSLRT